MSQQIPNRLIKETSPYLLQHAYNPVDWYAWGEEALQKAKESDKPILVSIGYSACHWCHVMEHESFENAAVAKIMNDHFVNIKIDREERPDLDAIYMDAVQAISGSGGWPLNVFLTPDKKPFYGGTYFPPVNAFNRSSWTEVLHGVAQAWKDRKHEIESQAENLLAYLHKTNDLAQPKNIVPDQTEKVFDKSHCDTIFNNIMVSADKEWGGFGRAPKFPQTFTIQYLLQYYHFTKNETALTQAILSIDKMLQGGIYDHLAGGLARYSTDAEWLAPHFEKMLYDNALLVNVLCDAYQITKSERYRAAIEKTISFVQQELMNSQGGFYAALDADSEGEEGKYYVWQKQEIDNILGEDAAIFCEYFDVSEEGNWEHKNILRILLPTEEFVKKHDLTVSAFNDLIENSRQRLLEFRNTRVRPGLDDKIILSWNALMLHAIAKAAAVLQDEQYYILAKNNYNFIIKNFKKDNDSFELYHTCKNGIVKYPAFLDDYAYFIQACIALYELTFDPAYLHTAHNYCNYVIENFIDEENAFFYFTNLHQTDVVIRKKEIYDGAMPSANAIMAKNIQHLALVYNNSEWGKQAELMVKTLKEMVVKYPTSFGNWAMLIFGLVTSINEITVSGPDAGFWGKHIHKNYIPNKVLMCAVDGDNDFPISTGKFSKSLTFIYLCKNYMCLAPFTSVEELMKIIEKTDYFE
ncbi:thioredoxin domain-containing protein [Ferruginibacter lapsinanis]|uniref:thioredoxin domain-containing protein n=1 Tax=Ferruginibacter lapsinanis TaxID=563172 RepID=UPI001E64322B|nr:thioredoxin domain-containing protein [Ferruginibacter lapsinanis]UEG51155.1 thioredoxin domain-containing protein [Ferruginibacter lapsinanis]